MAETKLSKFVWLIIGGVVGGGISLTYKAVIELLLEPKPVLTFSASSVAPPNADFKITNNGGAAAENVSVTIWATAPFASRTDIIEVSHTGGEVDAKCEAGLYEAKLTSIKSSIPNALNTEAKAVLITCSRIRSGENWSGSVIYDGPEAVFGLMALVKDDGSNEILYGRFSEQD